MSYLSLKNVCKNFVVGDIQIEALKNISFDLDDGCLAVILGQSGAGKTTLLNLLGGMDNPTTGDIIIDNKNISSYSRHELTRYRRDDIGFVFQFYNLMPNLTALENVELATELCKDSLDSKDVLRLVGLENRMNSFPSQLSGGEQQRVSIARSIAKNPKLLLCDEPTGALDSKTGKNILKLLQDLSKNQKKLVIIVTHNQTIKEIADKVIYIKNGEIEKIEENKNPKLVEEIDW